MAMTSSQSPSSSYNLLEATSRVALAAMLHDIGKFAERARIEVDPDRLNTHKNIYCPSFQTHYSHVHAAYSALVIEELEQTLPDLVGEEMFPFASWGQSNADDSLLNAAAKHHRPETFLQWIVATADRTASGLDRERFKQYNEEERTSLNHYTTRQWTLFERIQVDGHTSVSSSPEWCYPLRRFAPDSIFPVLRNECESAGQKAAQAEYRQLWEEFQQAIHQIPLAHMGNLALWLDHFDTLWMLFTHAIPAATFKTKPDVSLYDHTKAVTALATALWRYHHERQDDPEAARRAMAQDRSDWNESKLLLVQGDLFGIQDFIFATGGPIQQHAARLLRGRSFYVSLLTECAALKVLDALSLPPTSQIINAAGKFLIVAPNTDQTRTALQSVQQELDRWCLEHTYGQVGIGLAWEAACCNDLQTGSGPGSAYRELTRRLAEGLEETKLRRFDLCGDTPPPAIFSGYLKQFHLGEPCAIDGRLPAEIQGNDGNISRLTHDQIEMGRILTQPERDEEKARDVLVISRTPLQIRGFRLTIPLFGFHVRFTNPDSLQEEFGRRAQPRELVRAWDIALPATDSEDPEARPWRGWARRHVNSYVPRFDEAEATGQVFKDFKQLAEEALLPSSPGGPPRGTDALMTVKGDIDDLGSIFQSGLQAPSFSRTAALSRQLNAFFAVYLPWLCRKEFPETYTVFAGGDDFFLIGPWRQQMELACRLRDEFQRYVGHNPGIHFSTGLVVTKPSVPIRYMARQGEEALEEAKAHVSKGKTKKCGNLFRTHCGLG